jgi:hypothetical protein
MFQCLEDPYHELEGQRHWDYHIPEVSFKSCICMLRKLSFSVWWYLFSKC